mgnify:CR=1 FL=1
MADTRKPPAGAPPSQDKTETEAAQPAAAGGKKAADNTPATREDIAAMRFEVGEMAMQFADGSGLSGAVTRELEVTVR